MIECRNISKIYRNGDNETVALDGASFSVRDGEFLAIMGPSGSGKSTLMNVLGLLDSPSSGTYFLDGRDVSVLSEDELAEIRIRKIGFVFQSFNLLPRTSVMRNVMLPLIYEGVPHARRSELAEEALRAVEFPESRWNHLSNQLSGGQMQRVAIARALVNAPSLILADEPTGNLDTKTGELVMAAFRKLNLEKGHTVILITHEHDIARYADRIITVRDGRIVSDFPNRDVRSA
ncbi:MAG: ABC transporter ATP-binding protein [Candidatus Moranbacteria bacterium]|nr:ABC transporter ATP-binding protein [Candidatus Moranbacteria bacterium]NTW45908.1 ABC transporter ATP-binding protein [Candidatus Moranbacteria bacterium]